MKDREKRLRRFPGTGEEVTTVQKHLPGRGAGSWLSLLEDFRRADVPRACEWGLHSGGRSSGPHSCISGDSDLSVSLPQGGPPCILVPGLFHVCFTCEVGPGMVTAPQMRALIQ